MNLISKLALYPIDNYICRDNLEEYILNCDDPVERKWRIKHLEATFWHLRHHSNFNVFLINVVPSFVFSIKLPPKSEKKTDRLTFLGKQIDFFMGKGSGRLAGFATDNQVIIENFRKEVGFLENHIIDKYLDRSNLKIYLENLINEGMAS